MKFGKLEPIIEKDKAVESNREWFLAGISSMSKDDLHLLLQNGEITMYEYLKLIDEKTN